MKRFLIVAAVVAAAFTTPAFASDVGVSLSIGQPGFYGQLDIGDYSQPQVIYREPIVIERVRVERPPIYLRVPPWHAKHWRKYCREYNACNERVFFVHDDWYNREYVPRYQERHRDRRDDRRYHDRNEGRRNHDRDRHDRGHGHGRDDRY